MMGVSKLRMAWAAWRTARAIVNKAKLKAQDRAKVVLRSDGTMILGLATSVTMMERGGGKQDNWAGRCPFHDELTPSFLVSVDQAKWKCFGCGAGGHLADLRNKLDHEKFDVTERLRRRNEER